MEKACLARFSKFRSQVTCNTESDVHSPGKKQMMRAADYKSDVLRIDFQSTMHPGMIGHLGPLARVP